jgi:hypothetical protein
MGNRFFLERIGQISANWIVAGPEREQTDKTKVIRKFNLAEPDAEVVLGWRGRPSATAAASTAAATTALLRKDSRHGGKENRKGGKFEQHDDDDDDDAFEDVAFEDCMCWKL